jgi:hypothetical protein
MTDTDGKLPSLFIAGAPKSGTSSIFRWLDAHPQTHGSTPKETCFFADRESHVFQPKFNSSLGLKLYRSAFASPPEQTRMLFEGTASYIYSRTALALIPEMPNRPKCLFILREPAAQIYSTYTYFRNNWAAIPHDLSFASYLNALRENTHSFGGNELVRDALDNAKYAPWLMRWRERLGADRMKVCTLEELKAGPKAFMVDLALWCGIDPAFYDDHSFVAENESYAPVNRSLQRLNIAIRDRLPKGRFYDATRSLYRGLNTRAPVQDTNRQLLTELRKSFAEANQQLEDEFGLDLSTWQNS